MKKRGEKSYVSNPLNFLDLDGTTQQTSPTSGNETDFLTGDSAPCDCRRFSDMLVVTTTMRMVHGVHGNTTSTRPVVTLGPVFVVCTTGLQERLVDPSSTGDDTNGSASAAADGLLRSRRETDPGLVVIRGVADDSGVVAGSAREGTAVTDFLLDVTDDGTFGEGGDGEDVADRESGLLAAVDECTGVQAFGGDEGLLAELVTVWVAEDDASKGSTTAGVVDDVLYNTPNVTIALSKVEWAEPGRVLVQVSVRFEDGVRAPLRPDNPTHFFKELDMTEAGVSPAIPYFDRE